MIVARNLAHFQRLAAESGWIIIGQIVTVIGSLVLVRVLTEYLAPSEYGQLTLGLTVAGLVNQVVMGGVIASVGRFYSIAAEKKDIPGYVHAAYRLMTFATAAVTVIALLLTGGMLWFDYFKWIVMVVAALVFSVLSGFNASLSSMQNAARHRSNVACHSALDAWLKIFLVVGVLLWLGASSTAVIICYALSLIVTMSSQLFFLRRSMPITAKSQLTSDKWVRPMWLYAWPFSMWGIFTWAQQVSDRWALQNFGGADDVGRYAALFQLGFTPIGVLSGMAMALFGPILYQRIGTTGDPVRNTSAHYLAWRVTFSGLAITAVAFGVTYFLHAWIFKLLVAASYASVSFLLPWVILAGGLFSAGQILALKLMSEMNPRAMTSAKIISAILGVGLNICGAALFGMQGVVAALVCFYAVYFIWMAWLTRDLPSSPINSAF